MRDERSRSRSRLATMLFCRRCMYNLGILTDAEAEKIFIRIKKYQEEHQIEITDKQIDSVEIIYKDK